MTLTPQCQVSKNIVNMSWSVHLQLHARVHNNIQGQKKVLSSSQVTLKNTCPMGKAWGKSSSNKIILLKIILLLLRFLLFILDFIVTGMWKPILIGYTSKVDWLIDKQEVTMGSKMWELNCPQEKREFNFFFKRWTYWVIHYYLTLLTQVKEYFYLFIWGSTEAWSYNVISHLQTNLIEDKAR